MQPIQEILLAVLLGAAAWWVVKRHRARVAAAAELRAQREALWLRRVALQKRFRERLLRINEESLGLMESLPGWVESAERHLDQAELDFADGAFAPFWSSVERAAVSLAGFGESVQKLESNSGEYVNLLTQYKGPAPAFAVSACATMRMKLATATSHRMHGIVRQAQRDFQFAVIYEHRKTNQILVAGFRSLAEAIEEMTSRLAASIDGLTASVDKMTTKLEESLERRKGSTAGADESVREQRVLEVLELIEQKRYPHAIPAS